MQKNIKTETVADFMARGGKVTQVTPKGSKKKHAKLVEEAEFDKEVDWDLIPMSLRIKFGQR